MLTRQGVWTVLVLVAVGLVVAGGVGLVGCGSDTREAAGAQGVQPTEDILLFELDEPTDKIIEPAGADKVLIPGITLSTNGHWYDRVMSEYASVVHNFQTKKNIYYEVEVVGERCMDDPDLCLSRDPNPFANHWVRSVRADPFADSIVFKSTQDGTMYVGVYGWDSGPDDGTVEYYVHARQCRFGTFRQ